MEAICSFEMSVHFQRTTRRYIPEERTPHNYRCENHKSYDLLAVMILSCILAMRQHTHSLNYIYILQDNRRSTLPTSWSKSPSALSISPFSVFSFPTSVPFLSPLISLGTHRDQSLVMIMIASSLWYLDALPLVTSDRNCPKFSYSEPHGYIGVLISLWLFLFPIFLFAAQPK
jgi:hypothetical protein